MSTLELPRGSATRIDLAAGDLLVIVSPDGKAAGDLTFLGFDPALTRDIVGFERWGLPVRIPFTLRATESMYDGAGEPHLRIESLDANGEIDALLPGCRRALYPDGRPGCRDLIPEALGVPVTRLTGMVSFWCTTTATPEYYDPFGTQDEKPGASLAVRALRPVTVGVSACPDTLIWTEAERILELTVTRAT